MSESRKNHFDIDGSQVKEEEHVATYKPIPESDTDFRTSKSNLSKSKEKVSPDGAEEKLLSKEDEAKIVTRVDMADAKYVVGDHRNGDAKIELDANKRQFSGLTKEELLKYAEDPFWVRLRWFMFVLFWALWLCMLAGAIAIIVRAPKCAPPEPKTWFQRGPLIDFGNSEDYDVIEADLPLLQASKVPGMFVSSAVCPATFEVLDEPDCMERFKSLVAKAKDYGVKVIVDLTANFVSTSHHWFTGSENRTGEYDDYFIWANGKGFNDSGVPNPPNNWRSTMDESAWTYSAARKQFYLHQYGEQQADLNFTNPTVVKQFDAVIALWMKAGASGIRLVRARQLVVNASLADERMAAGRGAARSAAHDQHAYWRHAHTADQPPLDDLLAHWAALTATAHSESVFTLREEGVHTELFLLQRNVSSLRPPSAAPLDVRRTASAVAAYLNDRVPRWPAIQLRSSPEGDEEAAALALLLPAAPVLDVSQLRTDRNETLPTESFSHLVALRYDASIEHGNYTISAVSARNSTEQLLACNRWKAGHTGYVGVWNAGAAPLRADLSPLAAVPDTLTVHHVSHAVTLYTNYSSNMALASDNVLVPPLSTVVLSYVPKTSSEK